MLSIRSLPVKRPQRWLISAVIVSGVAIAAVACGNGDGDADTTEPPASTGNLPVGAPAQDIDSRVASTSASTGIEPPAGFQSLSVGAPAPVAFGVPTFASVNGSQQVGIWVNGIGSQDVPTDVANISIGVESREATVERARNEAADAMNAVLDAIRDIGIPEDDIVTTSFSIQPQVVWIEVTDSIGRHSEPRITGYIVTNRVNVTVRNLDDDSLTRVIDSATEEGGDLIRINSISFSVDDPSAFGEETRRLAAADATAKAQLYADAMGVTLGPLVFLSEIGSSAPLAMPVMARAEAAFDSGFAPTPITTGETTVSTTIQAVFAIGQ